ncbi:hypothetical protein ETB97_000743 [Aspergillus alliaceus]|uniref:Uncharacterized protein n=1 Tax=Petromyces alliaceus TaxID=209559 RepID=A0A5N6GEB1_PETAA|nr:uncharacterized protein BDW43DRAFT_258385 [Aspergillus alliaceus]KAB8239519.1 hypothetical protein BDW43DRAFT_258385 [Aspergillus alliaceus]KAE8392433.1 hypothetical protein BDV23DRAFT_151224 [Aspergillus alliaceus]KAF5861054.1 hypothetical protein ETB97_000743 [Aspergillus burnettii]
MAPSALASLSTQLPWKDEKRTGSSRGLNGAPEAESLVASPGPVAQDYDPTVGAKPYSPFYRHATPSIAAMERLNAPNKSPNIRTSDLESGWRPSDDSANRRSSKLWANKKRHCDWLRGMTRGQRIAVKAAIAILTLGTMVGIALGITSAVGGGVWKSDHQQGTIGS